MTASFDVHPLSRFTGVSTSIRRPREVAYFSYDDNRKLYPHSEQSLKYYHPPFFDAPGEATSRKHPLDLSRGFESFKQHDDQVDEHIDALLDTLVDHEQREGDVVSADIVTWRGMMTKILTAPYDRFSEFEMNATCSQGTIFIEENHAYKRDGEQQQKDRQPRDHRSGQPSQAVMQYWGYKFESLCVLDRPWCEVTRDEIETRGDATVSNEAQYCSIVRTGIGSSSLIIGGEVDAVLGAKPINRDDPIPWIELKTSQQIMNEKDASKYESKLLRFWAQSFLLGVPKIIVGFRSQDGHLMQMEELETQKIPTSVLRQGRRSWDGNVCINFTAAFLDFLKEKVQGKGVVWRIQRKKGDGTIRVFTVESPKAETILKPSFVEHRRAMQTRSTIES